MIRLIYRKDVRFTVWLCLGAAMLLFLSAGCSMSVLPLSGIADNMQDGYYVVDERDGRSVRQWIEDASPGWKAFGPHELKIPTEKKKRHDFACKGAFGSNSKWIGYIFAPGEMLPRSVCTKEKPSSIGQAIEYCARLGKRLLWHKPEQWKFACGLGA